MQRVSVISGVDLYQSSAAESKHQVSAVASELFLLAVSNGGASDVYVQIHDSATTPSESAVPCISYLVPAGLSASYDFWGDRYSNGIYVCASSTQLTKTNTGQTDTCLIRCRFNKILY